MKNLHRKTNYKLQITNCRFKICKENYKIYKNFFLLLIFWFLLISNIYSGGLSSPCGIMTLGNLKIGQEYSLKQLLGYPYNVTYKGRYPVDLKIELSKPSTTNYEGYEPIPDTSWIQLQKQDFSLDPGQTAETDIFIKIPDDESLLGKKYRVIITPYTGPPKGDPRGGLVFAVSLSCHLQFSIAPKPPTEEEIRQQRKRVLSNYVNFSVSPERIFLYDLKPNKTYNLTKEFGEVIKIINATPQDVKVSFEQIKASSIGIFLPEDTTEIEDLTLLRCVPKKFTLKKDSIKSVNLLLSTKGLENKKSVETVEGESGLEEGNSGQVSSLPKKYFTAVKVNFSNKYTEINNYVKFYIEIK
ncbi:MAG: hypothetical protein SNJ64_02080 [Endomicrobiia bacterium]